MVAGSSSSSRTKAKMHVDVGFDYGLVNRMR